MQIKHNVVYLARRKNDGSLINKICEWVSNTEYSHFGFIVFSNRRSFNRCDLYHCSVQNKKPKKERLIFEKDKWDITETTMSVPELEMFLYKTKDVPFSNVNFLLNILTRGRKAVVFKNKYTCTSWVFDALFKDTNIPPIKLKEDIFVDKKEYFKTNYVDDILQ